MYMPRQIPLDADLPALRLWMQQEVQNIASAMQDSQDSVRLKTLYAEPSRIYEDMVVRADGTTWNPGSGAGVYTRVSSVWVKL